MNYLKAAAQASTLEALLAVVNDFLLEQGEEFWSWVPRASRPTLVASAAELHHWHRKLADDLASATMPNVRMQDVCVFFARASARALEIDAAAPGADECSNDSLGASKMSDAG